MAYNPLNPNGQAAMAASQPVVIASNQTPVSVAGTVIVSNFPTNPSVSGTVAVSNFPVSQNVNGSVVAFQGTTPWVTNSQGSIEAIIIGGSIAATFTPPANQSVSGTVQVDNTVTVKSSIAGGIFPISGSVAATVTNFPATQNVSGSVVTFQGGTVITSLVNTVPSSVLVGASIIGLTPVNVTNTTINVSGSVVASGTVAVTGLQGHSVSGTVQVGNFPTTQNVSGSVIAFPTGTQAVSGSVATLQGTNPWIVNFQNSSIFVGFQAPSIVGTYSEDATHTTADKGLFTLGVRNDAVASFASANLEYGPIATDSAGRTLTKPFAPDQANVRGMASNVGTSVTALLAAAGTGLRNYITDLIAVNTGAATAAVNLRDSDASIIARIIVPTGGGSNMLGLATPLRTGSLNSHVDMVPLTPSSIITITAFGYIAP